MKIIEIPYMWKIEDALEIIRKMQGLCASL